MLAATLADCVGRLSAAGTRSRRIALLATGSLVMHAGAFLWVVVFNPPLRLPEPKAGAPVTVDLVDDAQEAMAEPAPPVPAPQPQPPAPSPAAPPAPVRTAAPPAIRRAAPAPRRAPVVARVAEAEAPLSAAEQDRWRDFMTTPAAAPQLPAYAPRYTANTPPPTPPAAPVFTPAPLPVVLPPQPRPEPVFRPLPPPDPIPAPIPAPMPVYTPPAPVFSPPAPPQPVFAPFAPQAAVATAGPNVGPSARVAAPASVAAVPAPPAAPARAAAAPSGGAGRPVAGTMAAYTRTLGLWLTQHEHYPDRARRNGEQGTVIVRVVIERDGQVSDLAVVQSSGNAALDDAALETWRRDRPPPLPPDIPQAVLRVPVHFKLDESW